MHKKMLKSHQKKKRASEKMIEKYGKAFPALCELSCKCTGNHSAACGCLTDAFISKAHTNFTSILMGSEISGGVCKAADSIAKACT